MTPNECLKSRTLHGDSASRVRRSEVGPLLTFETLAIHVITCLEEKRHHKPMGDSIVANLPPPHNTVKKSCFHSADSELWDSGKTA